MYRLKQSARSETSADGRSVIIQTVPVAIKESRGVVAEAKPASGSERLEEKISGNTTVAKSFSQELLFCPGTNTQTETSRMLTIQFL